MQPFPSSSLRFQWCALAATVIAVLALLPQAHFWLARGSKWNGAYAVQQPDELLYSAYVNALIEGRPRRNDPVSGRDDHPQARLPESFFSIQAIPPYVIAYLARSFHVSASTAFVFLTGLAGLLAGLAIFWLIASVTNDSKAAALGVLIVLCFGALAGGQGVVGLLVKPEVKFLGLPFLRRYEPAAPFFLVFVFFALTWQALTTTFRRRATINALLAGVALNILIFSYFYLWTAAFAWFVCIACLWLVARPTDRRKSFRIILVVSAPAIPALGLYVFLLTQLPSALGKAQVLTFTHRPDLLRVPEIVGAVLLLTLLTGLRRVKIQHDDPRVVITAACALLPFVVFNQQLITGRSIQPFHYEILIANYVVLVGLVLVAGVLQPVISRRATFVIAASCVLWGLLEVSVGISARISVNVRNDEMVPVLLRLKERADEDGTWEGLRNRGKVTGLVFSPEYSLSGILPTWAPHGSLLATGSGSFQTISEAESKEGLYTHFYYCGRSKEYLSELLNDRIGDPFGVYYVKTIIFGPERVVTLLGTDVQAIRQDEIDHEVAAYASFLNSFSRTEVLRQPLEYAVVPADINFDFANLDLWYERDTRERVGAYDLYHLKPRE